MFLNVCGRKGPDSHEEIKTTPVQHWGRQIKYSLGPKFSNTFTKLPGHPEIAILCSMDGGTEEET